MPDERSIHEQRLREVAKPTVQGLVHLLRLDGHQAPCQVRHRAVNVNPRRHRALQALTLAARARFSPPRGG